MGLLSFLFGCGTKEAPYHKRDGTWYFEKTPLEIGANESVTPLAKSFARIGERIFFRSTAIDSVDAASFAALDEHYAKDKARVYYCDTYRRGQDYYLIKYDRVAVLPNASSRAFQVLTLDYARDDARVFHEGREIAGADAPTFEVLAIPYARDRRRGYYHQEPIAGSNGASFVVLDDHFSRDDVNVYYSVFGSTPDGTGTRVTTKRIDKAQPSSFVALQYGYASDDARIYYNDKAIADASSPLTVFDGSGYAKTATQVFYRGERVRNADPATFALREISSDSGGDAFDAHASYREGQAAIRR